MNKQIEARFLELARSQYAHFPNGTVMESESPDFTLVTPNGSLGIEVTQLMQTATANFAPKSVEAFQRRVVQLAQKIHEWNGGVAIDVSIIFSSSSVGQQATKPLANALAEFVRVNQREGCPVLHFPENGHGESLPAGVDQITIAVPLLGSTRPWFATAVSRTPLLTYDFLAKAIARKDARVPTYRSRVDEVWLLLVAEDVFTLAGNLNVPRSDIDGWLFDSAFDRLLLLSGFYSTVWELKSASTRGA